MPNWPRPWLRQPRTPLEMLVAGTAMLAATVVLIAIMIALYSVVNAFAVAGLVLALIIAWEFAVEAPRQRARLAETLATQSRPLDEISL